MAKNFSYQQPANTSSMSSSYSVYNQPQQNTSQPQQNTSQPQRNNSQQSSYAAPQQQQQQQAAPLNMAAYSPQPQQAARIPSPGQAQGIEPRSNGTPYMPPGAVRETSDFLAPEVRARLAAQQSTPASPTLGSDAWIAANWANRNQPATASSMAPSEPQRGFEPWLNPQPQQSPASGRDAWNQAGRPGWDPNGTYTQDTGTAKDGTAFGLSSEADAYDRWRAGSSGNAQPNPTQPPPYGRYGGPRVDPWVGATPENPAYDPGYSLPVQGNPGGRPPVMINDPSAPGGKRPFVDNMPRRLENPGENERYAEFIKRKGLRPGDAPGLSRIEEFLKLEAQRPENMQRMEEGRQRHEATVRAADERMKEWGQPRLFSDSPPPRPAPQPGQNSYGFRGYDIDNGYSIRPEASPANAANFGGGPKPNLFSQSFTSPDGTTSDQPNFAQRDAFLNNLLDHDSENPGGMYQGSGRAPQSFMNPRPDIMGMWDKAGSMARDGWTNPVAGLLETRQPQRPNDAIGVPTSAPPPDPKQGRWPGQEFGQGPPREVSDAEVSRLADKIMSRDGYTGGRQRAEGTARAQLNGTWK